MPKEAPSAKAAAKADKRVRTGTSSLRHRPFAASFGRTRAGGSTLQARDGAAPSAFAEVLTEDPAVTLSGVCPADRTVATTGTPTGASVAVQADVAAVMPGDERRSAETELPREDEGGGSPRGPEPRSWWKLIGVAVGSAANFVAVASRYLAPVQPSGAPAGGGADSEGTAGRDEGCGFECDDCWSVPLTAWNTDDVLCWVPQLQVDAADKSKIAAVFAQQVHVRRHECACTRCAVVCSSCARVRESAHALGCANPRCGRGQEIDGVALSELSTEMLRYVRPATSVPVRTNIESPPGSRKPRGYTQVPGPLSARPRRGSASSCRDPRTRCGSAEATTAQRRARSLFAGGEGVQRLRAAGRVGHCESQQRRRSKRARSA